MDCLISSFYIISFSASLVNLTPLILFLIVLCYWELSGSVCPAYAVPRSPVWASRPARLARYPALLLVNHPHTLTLYMCVLATLWVSLLICYESDTHYQFQEKVELFLELYGNTLVRPHTADYYRNKASQLIKLAMFKNPLSLLPKVTIIFRYFFADFWFWAFYWC